MKKILFLILVFFLISCEIPEKPKEKPTTTECISDFDCSTGGCSGQICGTKEKVKGIITTCEWLEEYGCLRLTSCKCINNKCQWEENSVYKECMDKFKKTT